MIEFTHEERTLMMLYSPGDLPGLKENLREMKSQLGNDEKELLALTDGVLSRLEQFTKEEFDSLNLFENFDGGGI